MKTETLIEISNERASELHRTLKNQRMKWDYGMKENSYKLVKKGDFAEYI